MNKALDVSSLPYPTAAVLLQKIIATLRSTRKHRLYISTDFTAESLDRCRELIEETIQETKETP